MDIHVNFYILAAGEQRPALRHSGAAEQELGAYPKRKSGARPGWGASAAVGYVLFLLLVADYGVGGALGDGELAYVAVDAGVVGGQGGGVVHGEFINFDGGVVGCGEVGSRRLAFCWWQS